MTETSFRPHNSHLINLDYVKKFVRHDGGYIEMTDGAQVPDLKEQKRSVPCSYVKIYRIK